MKNDQLVNRVILDIEKKLDKANILLDIEGLRDLEEIRYILINLVNKYSYREDE